MGALYKYFVLVAKASGFEIKKTLKYLKMQETYHVNK